MNSNVTLYTPFPSLSYSKNTMPLKYFFECQFEEDAISEMFNGNPVGMRINIKTDDYVIKDAIVVKNLGRQRYMVILGLLFSSQLPRC